MYFIQVVALLLLQLPSVLANGAEKSRIPLKLAVFYEEELDRYDFRCVESASEVALRYINNDSTLLPEHQLQFDVYHHFQSSPQLVQIGSTVKSWFDMLAKNFTTQGIIGPSNSRAMLGLHEMNIDQWIPMIGYAAIRESPFPKQFDIRINPTTTAFMKALMAFVKMMGWKRFGILYTVGSLTFKTENIPIRDELIALLKDYNAEKIVTESFSIDINKPFKNQFQNFKDNDIRIIILLAYDRSYYNLFCEAYHHDMKGKDYVYIGLHDFPNLRRFRIERTDCTMDNIREVADGAFTFNNQHVRLDEEAIVITGKNVTEMRDEIWKQKTTILRDQFCHEQIYNSAFDAVYNMAIGYHSLLYNKDGKKVKDFVITGYGDKEMLRVAAQSFTKVSFQGLTGHIKYDVQNQRLAQISLIKFNSSLKKAIVIAYHDGVKFHYIENEKMEKYELFKDGVIPIDGYLTEYHTQTHNMEMQYVIWTFAGTLIFASLVFLFINIIYRKRSLIKMSSPNINNIILVGSILCYVTIIIHGMDGHCNEEVVVLAVGFTLLFGGLFCKTWRVYRIFTAVELLRTITIKDTQLYLMVFFLITIDAILCTVWMIISPYEVETTELSRRLLPDNQTQLVEVFHYCSSPHQRKFEVTMFIYKGLLMVFGLFLAFETRKVEIPALNDAKQIGLSIYTVVVMGILGTICCYALQEAEFMNARYAILTLSIVVSTVATILFLFLPKLIVLFGKDPDGLREKREIRSRYLSDDSINTQSTTDSRSRTVSRKEITDNGNLSIVYENQATTVGSTQASVPPKQPSTNESGKAPVTTNNNAELPTATPDILRKYPTKSRSSSGVSFQDEVTMKDTPTI